MVDCIPVCLIAIFSNWALITKRHFFFVESCQVSYQASDPLITDSFEIVEQNRWRGDSRLTASLRFHSLCGDIALLGLFVWGVICISWRVVHPDPTQERETHGARVVAHVRILLQRPGGRVFPLGAPRQEDRCDRGLSVDIHALGAREQGKV